MSYFNEPAGGPENGHNHLVDSNIDWGQDLLELRDWYRQHPEARPFGLAYYHFLDPRLFGIDYQLPPLGPAVESDPMRRRTIPNALTSSARSRVTSP